MKENYKRVFWEIGKAILEKARKNTLFDDSQDLLNTDESEDNITCLRNTAEKLSILRPVLKPQLFAAMMNIFTPHCAKMLSDVIQSFYPDVKVVIDEDTIEENDNMDEDDELPIWMKQMHQPIMPGEEKATNKESPPIEDMHQPIIPGQEKTSNKEPHPIEHEKPKVGDVNNGQTVVWESEITLGGSGGQETHPIQNEPSNVGNDEKSEEVGAASSSAPKTALDGSEKHPVSETEPGDVSKEKKKNESAEPKSPQRPPLKRRLRRNDSGYEPGTGKWMRRSQLRNEVINEAKETFDFIIDVTKNDESRLSAIISDLERCEVLWTSFPKNKEDLKRVTVDKLTCFRHQCFNNPY